MLDSLLGQQPPLWATLDEVDLKLQAEQAEANKLLSQSLTPELIRYQQLQRWDGKLPVFSGSGATPLIDATSIISDTAR